LFLSVQRNFRARSRAKVLNRGTQTGAFWGRLSGQALLDVYRFLLWVILVLQARVSFFSGAKMGPQERDPAQELCGMTK
jgi:hypothetical protein